MYDDSGLMALPEKRLLWKVQQEDMDRAVVSRYVVTFEKPEATTRPGCHDPSRFLKLMLH
jgi:hypothetical protein